MEFVVLVLPAVAGFIFLALLNRKKGRTLAERFFMMFLANISTFLLFDTYTVFPHEYSIAKVVCLICNGYLAPCIGITICFISWCLTTVRQRYRPLFHLFYVFSFVVFLAELLNYVGFGMGRAAEFFENNRQFPAECQTDTFLYHIYGTFEFFAVYVYNLVCAVSFAISIFFVLWASYRTDLTPRTLVNFLFRRGPLRMQHIWTLSLIPLYVFAVFRMYYGSHYLTKHPETSMWLSVIALIGVIAMGVVALKLRQPCVYLVRPHRQPMYDDLPVHIFELENGKPRPIEEMPEEESWDNIDYKAEDVRDGLAHLMHDEACFLYPGLSIYHASEMLGMNNYALNRCCHGLFHMSYQVYVMVQRVEYCRRYRDRYAGESEVEISIACGFASLEEMQSEWRECRVFFRHADKLIEQEKEHSDAEA